MISKNLVKYIIALIAIVALVLSIIAVAKKCKDKFGDTGCPPGVSCDSPLVPMYTKDGMQKWYVDKNGVQPFPHKYGSKPLMVSYDTNNPPFTPCFNKPIHGSCDIFDLNTSNTPSWIKSLKKYREDNLSNLTNKVIVPKQYDDLNNGWKLIDTPPPPY